LKRNKFCILSLTTLLLLNAVVTEESANEFHVTSNLQSDPHPEIYGNVVVWINNDNIWGYDVSTRETFQISESNSVIDGPAIYENVVIWIEICEGDYCIHGRDLSTWNKLYVTMTTNCIFSPTIHGNTVFWIEDINDSLGIYGYNLITEEKFTVTKEGEVSITPKGPVAYDSIVVWQDYRAGNPDVYGYDFSTSTEFQIRTSSYGEGDPMIYKNVVVYDTDKNGNGDIYGYDLSTKKEFQITSDPSDQYYPAIYGDIVVWWDERNTYERQEVVWRKENFDIYGYDLSTGREFPITTAQNDQVHPSIYGNIVVWTDYRNCYEKKIGSIIIKTNADIYGCIIQEKTKKTEKIEENDGFCSGTVFILLLIIFSEKRKKSCKSK